MSSSDDSDPRRRPGTDARRDPGGDPEIVRVGSGRAGPRTLGVAAAVVIAAIGLAILKPWEPAPSPQYASPEIASRSSASPPSPSRSSPSPAPTPAPTGIAVVEEILGPLDGPSPAGRVRLPWRVAWERVGTSFAFDAWGIVAIAVPRGAASGSSDRVPTDRTWTPVVPVRGDGPSDASVRSGAGGGPPAVGGARSDVVAIGFTWPAGIRITDIRLDRLVGMVDGRIAEVDVPVTPIDRAADPDNRALPSVSGLWWGAPPDAASRGSGAVTFGDSWPPGPYRLHFDVSGQPRSVTFSLRSAVSTAAGYSSVVP